MKIKSVYYLYALMDVFLFCGWLRAQTISVSVTVPLEFGVLPPTIPGDPVVTTYENTLGDAQLDIDGGNKFQFGDTWCVTVSKSTGNWHANLELDVRRDPSRTDVINGSSYVTIPDGPSASYFFESNAQRRARNLSLQHRVQIVGDDPPASTYTTTITYTLVDM